MVKLLKIKKNCIKPKNWLISRLLKKCTYYKEEADADKERIEYLVGLNQLLQEAIMNNRRSCKKSVEGDCVSKFEYIEEEIQINKVLKMNQDLSKELMSDKSLASTRSSADDSIASSMELLKSLGKEVDKLTFQVKEQEGKRKLEHRPQLEDWETILAEAEAYLPDVVTLEEILSEEEIQQSFQELEDINDMFSKKTSIVNKTDLSFLAIATALQVVKSLIFPYVAEKFDYGESFDPEERLDHNDKSIEQAHRDANDKFRDKNMKKHGTGHWINILYQTVPYDITRGSKDLGINMGGKYHRMYTLGHDPVLGWIFGTANILTDCITFNNFRSDHWC